MKLLRMRFCNRLSFQACTHNSRYTLKVKIVFEASSLVYMYITSSMKIHSLTILSWFSDFHIIILRHVFFIIPRKQNNNTNVFFIIMHECKPNRLSNGQYLAFYAVRYQHSITERSSSYH